MNPQLGDEHLDNACLQYDVAEQMRYREPRVANSQPQ